MRTFVLMLIVIAFFGCHENTKLINSDHEESNLTSIPVKLSDTDPYSHHTNSQLIKLRIIDLELMM